MSIWRPTCVYSAAGDKLKEAREEIKLRIGNGGGRSLCRPWAGLMLGLGFALALGCDRPPPPTPAPAAPPVQPNPAPPAVPPPVLDPGAERAATLRYLADNQVRFQAAVARARAWLDRLEVNPLELREHNVKGKKKLGELLDSYRWLLVGATPAEQKTIRARLRQVTAVTADPAYHDMLTVSDAQFKQDATSYLRAAYLMERLGLDTKLYRAEIKKVQPRLDAHLATRGPHQLMAFHWYYQFFGLPEPFPLDQAFEQGIIRSRRPPDRITEEQAYALTHEIFVPYHYGEDLAADFFTPADQAYLRPILERLTAQYLQLNNPDLTAELVACLRYLDFVDLPVYRQALEYLLAAQRPEGAWGDYEKYRGRLGPYVDQALYLHTVDVTVGALVVSFQFPPKADGGPPP